MNKPGIIGALFLLITSANLNSQAVAQTEVSFKSAGYTLYGELTMPAAPGKVPVIVFLTGAGANSSYLTLYKPFVDEYLKNLFLDEGYAILNFDKRGVGKSEGKWQTSTIYDRADDAKAAIDFLKTVPGIDAARIGLVGHSQGAWVAQVTGALYPADVKAVASLAGPVFNTRMSLTNDYYSRFICEGENPEAAFTRASKKALSDINWVDWFPVTKPWRHLKRISDFDPAAELRSLNIPALFVFAENDNKVYPGWAIQSLNETFDNAIPENFTLQIIPGANHDLKMAPMCASPGEIEQAPYSDYFKQVFKSWILTHL